MNTADRSIALLNVALRRRFAFVEIMPRTDLLDDTVVESSESAVPLGNLLQSLNRGILKHIDRDHQIGHSYFLKVAQAEKGEQVELLEFVWNNQILPLLEEYFYSQRDKLAEVLAPFITEEDVSYEAGEDGKYSYEIGRQSEDDLMFALEKLADSP